MTLRVVFDGPLVSESSSGGPAVHERNLLRAMLCLRPELALTSQHATLRRRADHRTSASLIHADVKTRTVCLPTAALRAMQHRAGIPRQRWLTPRFDLFHQFHTDAVPAVPGSRLVVTLHDLVALTWPAEEGRMSREAPRVLGKAAAVITGTEHARHSIIEQFDLSPAKVRVIPSGVDLSLFKPGTTQEREDARGRFAHGQRYLLYLGGSTPRKNLPRIVKAFSDVLLASGDDLRLVLAGSAGLMRNHLMDDFPSVARHLVSVGHVAEDELFSLYTGAECLLFASLAEGFGLPILEAFACGTPVVTSNRSSMPEVAGGAAELVDPADSEAIAAGVLRILHESSEEKQHRAKAALARAEHFSWARTADLTLQLYDQVLDGTVSAAP